MQDALNFAAEESERLAQRYIGTEHLLLGMLRVEGSLAAKLLGKRGLKPEVIRQQLAKAPGSVSLRVSAKPSRGAIATLDSFLAGLKGLNSEQLISFFAENAEFIDASGKRWNRGEIWRGFETLFALYAKKNATYVVEGTLAKTSELFVATVLWKNALLVSEQRAWMHRMSVVLLSEADGWEILLAQVTQVQFF
jgi:ClpA/ClpB-like protein